LFGVGFGFERRARSRKARSGLRALLGRAPEAQDVRDRLARLLPRMWKGVKLEVTAKQITADLHDFAPPLRIAIDAEAELRVSADVGFTGPAYCDDIAARMAPVLDELDYAWAGSEPDPRAAILGWLAEALRGGATRIAMPADRIFLVDAPIQTALGPRDAAWRDAVLADPRAGKDAFAWWDHRPGHLERARALLAMWHEVAWREPCDRAEHALLRRVDADLRAARKADRSLGLPYAEWAELVELLGDGERAAGLRAQATGPATLGYRRYDMDLELAGWSITLPGAFVGGFEDDRYWATDGRRAIELHTLETTEADSAKLLAVAPTLHPVIERIAEPGRHGRVEAHQEDDVHIVHGLVAIAPRVAILTCKGAARDQAWALAAWRSLRIAPAAA
jgi:hypothetical protein